MQAKIKYLKQQIECRYFQPCFACRVLCGGALGNELFEIRYQGVKLKTKLEEMQGLQPERQGVYDELEKILPADELYEFLGLIDAGFDILVWDIYARQDAQWGSELDRLVRDMRAVLRKNKRLGWPIKIQIQNPYMINERFKWSAKLSRGRPTDSFEKFLLYQMFGVLIKRVKNKTRICTIVRKIYRYFYGQYKSFDVLYKRHLPAFLELKQEK